MLLRFTTSRLAHLLIVSTQTNASPQSIEVYVNCLKAATPPFLHAQSSSGSGQRLWNDPIPWIGITILVSKSGHTMKGYRGIVKTVLCKQPTKSSLSVVAQLAHLDSSCPYKTVVLDYDDVIEAKYVNFAYMPCAPSDYMIVIGLDVNYSTSWSHKASSLFLLIKIIWTLKYHNALPIQAWAMRLPYLTGLHQRCLLGILHPELPCPLCQPLLGIHWNCRGLALIQPLHQLFQVLASVQPCNNTHF
jgi:hypothetical protein